MKTNPLSLIVYMYIGVFFLITASCTSIPVKQMTNTSMNTIDNKKIGSNALEKNLEEQNNVELIVQLEEAITPAIWIQKYGRYNTTLLEPLSEPTNIHLVSFDANSIEAERFIKLLSRDKAVLKVQSNEKIAGRDDSKEASHSISNQVIIQLSTDIAATDWLKRYEKHNLQLLESISKNRNIHLFSFDEENIATEDIVKILNRDKQVEKVEVAKKVKSR